MNVIDSFVTRHWNTGPQSAVGSAGVCPKEIQWCRFIQQEIPNRICPPSFMIYWIFPLVIFCGNMFLFFFNTTKLSNRNPSIADFSCFFPLITREDMSISTVIIVYLDFLFSHWKKKVGSYMVHCIPPSSLLSFTSRQMFLKNLMLMDWSNWK